MTRKGRPPQAKMTVEEFWSLVDKSAGKDACWLWRGAVGDFGYGVARVHGVPFSQAYRVMITLSTGQLILPGFVVRHLCHTPQCVNPQHLRVGTHGENVADSRFARGYDGIRTLYELPPGCGYHWGCNLDDPRYAPRMHMVADGDALVSMCGRPIDSSLRRMPNDPRYAAQPDSLCPGCITVMNKVAPSAFTITQRKVRTIK